MTASARCARCERNGHRPPYQPMLRLLAVDDEPPVLAELAYLLRSDARVASVELATDSISAVRMLQQEGQSDRRLDAVFLDVRMPGLTGLDVARLLAQFAAPPAVVFVSAHEDSAVEAFELKALDYLLKPVRPERVADAIHRVLHAVDERSAPDALPEPEPMSTPATTPVSVTKHPIPMQSTGSVSDGSDSSDMVIPVELGGTTRFVKLADVHHVEAQGDYVRLHTRASSFLVRTPMSTVEERWRSAGFVRIHRSYLVALPYVQELRLDSGRLTVLVAGVELPVSRRHAKAFRDLLVRNAKETALRGEQR